MYQLIATSCQEGILSQRVIRHETPPTDIIRVGTLLI
jgi:hypothetical protein